MSSCRGVGKWNVRNGKHLTFELWKFVCDTPLHITAITTSNEVPVVSYFQICDCWNFSLKYFLKDISLNRF